MIESSFELLRALKKQNLLDGKSSWWWPNAGRFEVILGSILVQNTQWAKVEKMLDSMQRAGITSGDCESDLEKLSMIESEILQSHIIGLQRQKSVRIIGIARHILEDFGSFEGFKENVDYEWLLAQKGIGAESACVILNYACEREVMVVDSYTHRLLSSLGWEIDSYDELREFCERGVRENLEGVQELYKESMSLAQIFARFHGKIVEFGKLKGDVKTLQF